MLIKNHIISFLTVIFILVGCDSDIQNLDNTADVSTEMPPNENNTSTDNEGETEEIEERLSKPVIVETKPSNWYIRLVAEDPARALKSSSSQLGELEENDAVEEHALKALNPLSGSYLDIVFVNPAGVVPGDYKSNFHVYEESVEDQWNFTVRTDDPNAEILLTWQGLYVLNPYTDDTNRKQYKEYRSVSNPLIKNMKLVDVKTGKDILISKNSQAQTYAFNMNGQNERVFALVVQTDEVIISADGKIQTYTVNKNNKMTSNWTVEVDELTNPSEISELSTSQTKEVKKDAVVEKTKVLNKKAEPFDLSKPPIMK
jgi:hypothetical protein